MDSPKENSLPKGNRYREQNQQPNHHKLIGKNNNSFGDGGSMCGVDSGYASTCTANLTNECDLTSGSSSAGSLILSHQRDSGGSCTSSLHLEPIAEDVEVGQYNRCLSAAELLTPTTRNIAKINAFHITTPSSPSPVKRSASILMRHIDNTPLKTRRLHKQPTYNTPPKLKDITPDRKQWQPRRESLRSKLYVDNDNDDVFDDHVFTTKNNDAENVSSIIANSVEFSPIADQRSVGGALAAAGVLQEHNKRKFTRNASEHMLQSSTPINYDQLNRAKGNTITKQSNVVWPRSFAARQQQHMLRKTQSFSPSKHFQMLYGRQHKVAASIVSDLPSTISTSNPARKLLDFNQSIFVKVAKSHDECVYDSPQPDFEYEMPSYIPETPPALPECMSFELGSPIFKIPVMLDCSSDDSQLVIDSSQSNETLDEFANPKRILMTPPICDAMELCSPTATTSEPFHNVSLPKLADISNKNDYLLKNCKTVKSHDECVFDSPQSDFEYEMPSYIPETPPSFQLMSHDDRVFDSPQPDFVFEMPPYIPGTPPALPERISFELPLMVDSSSSNQSNETLDESANPKRILMTPPICDAMELCSPTATTFEPCHNVSLPKLAELTNKNDYLLSNCSVNLGTSLHFDRLLHSDIVLDPPQLQPHKAEHMLRTPKKQQRSGDLSVFKTTPRHEHNRILYPRLQRTPPKNQQRLLKRLSDNQNVRQTPAKRILYRQSRLTHKSCDGCERLDVLGRLEQVLPAVDLVLQFLSNDDLQRVTKVSKRWCRIVNSSAVASKRLTDYRRNQFGAKENAGSHATTTTTTETYTTIVLLPIDVKKSNRPPFRRQNAFVQQNKYHAPIVRTPTLSPKSKAFNDHLKMVQTLKTNQTIIKCPRCQQSSIVNKPTEFASTTTKPLRKYFSEEQPQTNTTLRRQVSLPFQKQHSVSLFTNRDRLETGSESRHQAKDSISLIPSATTEMSNELMDGFAQCTSSRCGFRFCPKCLCDLHRNGKCMISEISVDIIRGTNVGDHNDYAACSKQSKRNLRRLCSLDA